MIRIKILLKPSSMNQSEGVICYRISKDGTSQLVKTEYKVLAEEWDDSSASVFLTYGERSAHLIRVQQAIERDVQRLHDIARRMQREGTDFSALQVVRRFLKCHHATSLFSFMQQLIGHLKLMGKVRTSETYTAALHSFMQFRKKKDVALEEVDEDLMQLYEAYLMQKGLTKNTCSFYMRIMRATYNRAVEKGLTMQRYPFRHVYTGVDRTMKRAIGLKDIKRLGALNLEGRPALDFARDMFLMSFYTRGMAFVDLAFLKKTDLKEGFLTYKRRKTQQQIVMKWERCMQQIAQKWGREESPYLLPIIKNRCADERAQYLNAMCAVNNNLKKVAKLAGLSVPLTMYVARHSWASIARQKNVPLSVISEGMGHDSENTTKIYLAQLDNSAIDRANAMILKMISEAAELQEGAARG